jgi:hypothetical protein
MRGDGEGEVQEMGRNAEERDEETLRGGGNVERKEDLRG